MHIYMQLLRMENFRRVVGFDVSLVVSAVVEDEEKNCRLKKSFYRFGR